MIASATKTMAALGLREGMTSLVCLDVNFIAGRMMIVRSLIAGMKMIIVEPTANPLEKIEPTHIDFAALVPYQLDAMLASSQRSQLNDIDKIILGGAAINYELQQKIQSLKAECYATFGMTETLSHIALQKLNGNHRQDFFEVLDGVKVSVDSRQCLVIDADYLDETVVTNDVVELIDARKFRWLGRFDNVINSGGVKIMPEKVENEIAKYLSSRFFVTSMPHELLGQQVVLVIEGSLGEIDETKLSMTLRGILNRFELPRQILYIDKFIETKTQKINQSESILKASPRPRL
jgi:O-succinylbenzoic acid--CoA ligase